MQLNSDGDRAGHLGFLHVGSLGYQDWTRYEHLRSAPSTILELTKPTSHTECTLGRGSSGLDWIGYPRPDGGWFSMAGGTAGAGVRAGLRSMERDRSVAPGKNRPGA